MIICSLSDAFATRCPESLKFSEGSTGMEKVLSGPMFVIVIKKGRNPPSFSIFLGMMGTLQSIIVSNQQLSGISVIVYQLFTGAFEIATVFWKVSDVQAVGALLSSLSSWLFVTIHYKNYLMKSDKDNAKTAYSCLIPSSIRMKQYFVYFWI